MNREILFRGKRIDNGEWLESGEVISYVPDFEKETSIYVMIDSIYCGDMHILESCVKQVDPTTIGQYTGLTDKNGQKIFEGDIVKFSKSINKEEMSAIAGVYCNGGMFTFIGRVNFSDCEYILSRPNGQGEDNIELPPVIRMARFYDNTVTLEVIGNIYDNPELLSETPCND